MFVLNGIEWDICFVEPYSPILFDYRNNVQSVATTDFNTKCIYLSNELYGDFLIKVLKHELYHCYEFSSISYDFPIGEEELIADFIATYGEDLINLAYDLYDML